MQLQEALAPDSTLPPELQPLGTRMGGSMPAPFFSDRRLFLIYIFFVSDSTSKALGNMRISGRNRLNAYGSEVG